MDPSQQLRLCDPDQCQNACQQTQSKKKEEHVHDKQDVEELTTTNKKTALKNQSLCVKRFIIAFDQASNHKIKACTIFVFFFSSLYC